MPGSQFRPVLALSLLLTIGALMGLTSILVKLAGNVGWPAMAYLLWSLLGGGLLLLLFTWIRGERPASARVAGLLPGLGAAQHRGAEWFAVQLHRPCRRRVRLDVPGLPASDHLPAGPGLAHGGAEPHSSAGHLHRPGRQFAIGTGQAQRR